MHIPAHHAVSSPPLLISFLRSYPLGLTITSYPPPPNSGEDDLQASHIPWIVDVPPELEPSITAAREEWDAGVVKPKAVDGTGMYDKGGLDEEKWADWKGKVKMRAHAARMNPQMKAILHHIREKERLAREAKESKEAKAGADEGARKAGGWWPFGSGQGGQNGQNSKDGAKDELAEVELEQDATKGDAPTKLDETILLVFTLPANHYISPSWYKGTKPVEGKVVPTWDYAAIQVYGKLTIYHAAAPRPAAPADPSSPSPALTDPNATPAERLAALGTTSAFLQSAITDLTNLEEGKLHPDGKHWELTDAPQNYLEAHKRPILGLELEVTRLEGRWKMSQDKGAVDYQGVREGLKGIAGCPVFAGLGAGDVQEGEGQQEAKTQRDDLVDGVEKAGKRWGQKV